ncbi:hypothetical protein WA556_005515 [Blastocystis sp. ATCC 50177/Nand II]
MVKNIIEENDYDPLIIGIWEKVNTWGWGKCVPLDECFELFNIPETSHLKDRVQTNFTYYRMNYLALYAAMVLIVAFSSPLFAALDLVLFILWMIPFVVVPHPFVLGEYRITPSCIVVGTAAVTALAFMFNVPFLGYFVVFHLLYALREC